MRLGDFQVNFDTVKDGEHGRGANARDERARN